MNIDDKEITLERRVKIIDLLEEKGQIKVADLSKVFHVSQVTIRNDLAQLENKGILVRTRGGGIKSQRVNIDFHLSEKAKRHLLEKQKIGKRTAELIKDDDTIILDSGTTTLEITKHLSHIKNLTIITNALNLASQLINCPQINVIMLGGILRRSSLSMIGPLAEANIRNFYCDKFIMGVDSIDSQYGISTPTVEEAQLNKLMIEISKEVIVVTDSSKFLRKSFAYIAPIKVIKTIVTDSNIPLDEYKNLTNNGIEVIIAE